MERYLVWWMGISPMVEIRHLVLLLVFHPRWQRGAGSGILVARYDDGRWLLSWVCHICQVSKRLQLIVAPLQICTFVGSALLDLTRWLLIPSRDDIVGRRLRWDGVERAIASMGRDFWGDEIVPLPPRTPARRENRMTKRRHHALQLRWLSWAMRAPGKGGKGVWTRFLRWWSCNANLDMARIHYDPRISGMIGLCRVCYLGAF